MALPALTAEGRSVNTMYFDANGTLLQASGPAPPPASVSAIVASAPTSGQPVFQNARIGGTAERVLAEVVDPGRREAGVLLLASPTEDLDRTLLEVGILLVVSAVLFVLASTGLAYWLSGRALASVRRIAGTARDLSERDLHRRVEVEAADDELGDLARTFNSMLARLENGFESLRQLTSDAAHELRAPLTLIRTDVELALSRPRTQAEYQRALSGVMAEVEHLSRMADQLLLLAQADAGSLAIRTEQVDVVDLVEESVDRWRPTVAGRRLHLVTELPPSGKLVADPLLLRRVLDNLLDNAVRFSPAGGTIVVAAEPVDSAWRLTVQDSGPGVDPRMRDQLFRRFARADPARGRTTGGAGLGLALSAAIVALHHGSIELEPGDEPGARFAIMLPKGGDKLDTPEFR